MKRDSKIAIGTLVLVGAAGLATNLGNRVETTGCETYQGYRNNSADGERIYFFDEKILSERNGNPNYALSGNHEMYRNLEMGEKYRLKIEEPILSKVFPKRLLSFEDCGQDSD